MKKLIALLIIGCVIAGCIRKKTTHTVYLEPDGSGVWMVLEQDVRSDEKDPDERWDEEQAYLEAVRAGTHDVTEALCRLDTRSVETRLLRDERPYLVVTEATFESVDTLINSLFEQANAPIRAEIQDDGSRMRLRILCDLSALERCEEPESPDDDNDVFVSLVEETETYSLVLAEGIFSSARGFRIEEEGTRAVLIEQSEEEIDAIEETDEFGWTVVYSLSWTTGGQLLRAIAG